jgi:hypothetical protein
VKSEVSTPRARDTNQAFDRGKQLKNLRSLVCEKLRETRTVQVMNFGIYGKCSSMPPPHKNCARSRLNCFEGACLDSVVEKSVCGLAQAKLCARRTHVPLRLAKTRIQFKFGDMTIPSIGMIKFNLPTPRGEIRTKVHIVQADVPLLLSLDILDKHKLVVNNGDDQLEGRSNPPNSKVL